MNRITDDLWITDIESVETKSTERFDYVVSVCQDTARDNVGCPYIHYPIADGWDSMVEWGGTTEYDVFEAACDTVAGLMDHGVTLVHCHRGHCRSASVCATALAQRCGIDYDVAVERIEYVRPSVDVDPYMEDLGRWYVRDDGQ